MKVATVSLLLVAGARCCPDGWFQVAGSCYRSSPDRLTWYQAQEVGGTNTVAGLGNFISLVAGLLGPGWLPGRADLQGGGAGSE